MEPKATAMDADDRPSAPTEHSKAPRSVPRLIHVSWVLTLLLGFGFMQASVASLDLCFGNQITVDGFNDVDGATKDANYEENRRSREDSQAGEREPEGT